MAGDLAFVHQLIPLIYAALGTVDEGASLEQILSRTKLERARVIGVLKTMTSSGLIEKCLLFAVSVLA